MHIARSRLAGEPADVLIMPRLSQMALWIFIVPHRQSAKAAGATNAVLSQLTHFLEEK